MSISSASDKNKSSVASLIAVVADVLDNRMVESVVALNCGCELLLLGLLLRWVLLLPVVFVAVVEVMVPRRLWLLPRLR